MPAHQPRVLISGASVAGPVLAFMQRFWFTGDGVEVTFERAAPQRYDLVVGADGLHSTIRRVVFGPEPEFLHFLGGYLAVYTVANYLHLDDYCTWTTGCSA